MGFTATLPDERRKRALRPLPFVETLPAPVAYAAFYSAGFVAGCTIRRAALYSLQKPHRAGADR